MEHARERWADLTNQMLEARGRDERVDHQTYERQGIDREAGEHYGPAATHIARRGLDNERLRDAAVSMGVADAIRSIERDIEILERGSGSAPSSGRGDGSEATAQAAPKCDEDLSRGR